jgi:hypothetical protein
MRNSVVMNLRVQGSMAPVRDVWAEAGQKRARIGIAMPHSASFLERKLI